MRFITILASVSFLSTAALAALTPLRAVEKFSGQTTGRYIVKLKDGVSRSSVLKQIRLGGAATHDWEIFNGFSGDLDADSLNTLRASPDVEYIAEDGIMHVVADVTQTNAPWGISRLSRDSAQTNTNAAALTFSFTYDSSAGACADVYVVDTGINTAHTQFGGRARWGATFGGYANADGNGHGTHCAGTIGSSQFGVAKSVRLIAVKVLSDAGSGSTSDIVSGLNWVLTQARASGRPSVVSMSLGGGASTALDNAVASLTAGGVHVVVAAGNDNANAANTSPARSPSAITVAASTIADAKASFSNYGAVVDIWAPGQNIISTWTGSTTATNSISGTSMATPHVAGSVAYLLCLEGSVTPAAMETKLKNLCLRNAISGVPSGTINCLLHLP